MPSSTVKKSTVKKSTRRNGTRGPANADALLAAAHRLIFERGEKFTTQDLIKEADVALQTFYRHFGGKDQLFLAVIAELIETQCNFLQARAADLDGPIERLHMYITETLSTLVGSRATGAGRFITSQHWRLHELYPDALAQANRPFADLVQRELEAARVDGLLAPRKPGRDAWIVSQLVMAVFHYYAFADDDGADTVADDVAQFCLAAVGGAPPPRRPSKTAPRTRRA